MRISDWSSDVCSSDLGDQLVELGQQSVGAGHPFLTESPDRGVAQCLEPGGLILRQATGLGRHEQGHARVTGHGLQHQDGVGAYRVGRGDPAGHLGLLRFLRRMWGRWLSPRNVHRFTGWWELRLQIDVVAAISSGVAIRNGGFSGAGATRRACPRVAIRLAMTETPRLRSEEHTSELQSLMRLSYAVSCWKKQKKHY